MRAKRHAREACEARDCRDDDHAERRCRERLDQRLAKRRKNPATAAATITAACDCAPAASLTAEREFEEETGKGASQAADDVSAAECGQFAVRVDVVAVSLRERPYRRDQVGERDERERGRRKQQISEVLQPDVRHAERRQPALDDAHGREVVAREVEDCGL